MKIDIGLILMTISALVGSVGAGIIGMIKNGTGFGIGEFASTIWAAILTASIFIMGYQTHGVLEVRDFVFAFLSGAGINVLNYRVNYISNAMVNRYKSSYKPENHDQAVSQLADSIGKYADKINTSIGLKK